MKSFLTHLQNDHGHSYFSTKFKCAKCDYTTNSQSQMDDHDLQNHTILPKMTPCGVCGRMVTENSTCQSETCLNLQSCTYCDYSTTPALKVIDQNNV